MSLETRPERKSRAAITAFALVAALAIGAAFAGWIEHGPQIFMTFATNTLAWCF